MRNVPVFFITVMFFVDSVINCNKFAYVNRDPMKTFETKRSGKQAVTVSFRCPKDVYDAAEKQLIKEDIDFSKLVRRALKREIGVAA